MSIKGLSEVRRLPRLGKIKMGIKHPEKGYPMKTDYFVCPPEVQKLYGLKPKELEILLPVEDPEQWCPQYYKKYSRTQGLVCKGDGEKAFCLFDLTTGAMADKETKSVQRREITCPGRNCLEYKSKNCKPVMSLQFLLYRVPGLGVYQVDTSSVNSIININSCADYIRALFGRVSMIPLNLTMEPKAVQNPESGKQQTVYVLNLRNAMALIEMSRYTREFRAQIGAGNLALPVADEAPVDEGELAEDGAEGEIIDHVEQPSTNGNGDKSMAELWDTQEYKIDLDWLRESLLSLNWKTVIHDYLKPNFNAKSETVTGCLMEMNTAQQKQFCEEVQRRLRASGK